MAKPSSLNFLYVSKPNFFIPAFINSDPIASLVPDVGGGTMMEMGCAGRPILEVPIFEETNVST